MILSGNTLYGTASEGGSSGHGTVFAVNTDGTDFLTLHSFADGSDGALPWAGLILSGNTLYGTAIDGGSSGDGTVFAVNTDGAGFTALHSFTDGDDGANPYGELVLSGGTLYGTADFGGSTGSGTVFAVNTDGTGFILPYSFSAFNPTSLVNSDGGRPAAGLILSGTTLYGTTDLGGSSGHGTVFSLSLSPQFSVSVTPGSLTVAPGGGATCDLTLDSLNGFSGEVTLSASGLPGSATASFGASSVSAPGAAALTITTASTIAPGSYTLTITGTSGSLVEQATVILVVAAPNFSITASPSLQSVKAGSSTTYEATVTPSRRFRRGCDIQRQRVAERRGSVVQPVIYQWHWFLHDDRHNQEHHAHRKHLVHNYWQRPEQLAGTQHYGYAHSHEIDLNYWLRFWLNLWKVFTKTSHENEKREQVPAVRPGSRSRFDAGLSGDGADLHDPV